MAKQGQQIDELFISLGLDIAQLQLDFDTAGQTVSSAISKLNSSGNKIKLQMETDLSKLDGVGSELDKIKVKYEAINRQLDLQRQKETILSAVLKDAQKNSGADSYLSRKAETDLLRQQKLIAQTEAEVRKLETALQQAGKAQNDLASPKSNSLLESYKNLKGTVSGNLNSVTEAFQSIKAASNSADGAITKSLEIIDKIPHPAGKAAAALAAIPLVMHGVENSLINLAKPAIAAGDSFYVMSRGMQMTIADAAKLSMICKVTGIDINEVNSAMRRLNMRLVNSDSRENNLTKTLKEYGVEVRNANGELKNYLDMSIAIADGLEKAKSIGKGKDFLAAVFGRQASGDLVTYIEDLKSNVEQAQKVIKNGLADPARAHAIQGELNTLEAQAGQLNSAFSSAFMPLAEVLIPRTTERLGELTKIIAENADGIKNFGTAAANVLDAIENVAAKVGGALIKTVGGIGEIFSRQKNSVVERYLNDSDVKSVEDLVQKELQQRYSYTERISIENNPALYEQTLNFYQPMFQALDDARKKVSEKVKAIQETVQENLMGASMFRLNSPELSDAELKNLKKTFEETQKLSDELFKLTHTDYENKELDIYNWQGKLLNDENTTAEQREIIAKITDEKLVQLEREREEKISAIRKSANAEFQNDIQSRIEKIDEEKAAWIKAGMEEEEATALAERQKAQAIKNLENEVAANIDSIWQTELEKRLKQIERERDAWIQKGVDEVKATQWAEEAKANAQKDAAMNVIKQQAKDYEVYQREGYGGLVAKKHNDLIKSGVNPDYLNMTPEQLRDFQEAQKTAENSLLPNFMTAEDKNKHQQRLQQWMAKMKEEYQRWSEQNYVIDSEGNRMNLDGFYYNQNRVLETDDKNKPVSAYNPKEFAQSQDIDLGISSASEDMQNFREQVNNSTQQLAEFRATAENVTIPSAFLDQANINSLQNFSEQVDKATIQLSAFSAATENVTIPSALGDEPNLNILQSFTDQASNMTQKLAEIGTKIANINLTPDKNQPQYYSDLSRDSQPVNDTSISININEATAWDSEHIQELADKVADVIKPAIEQALGGNGNSY